MRCGIGCRLRWKSNGCGGALLYLEVFLLPNCISVGTLLWNGSGTVRRLRKALDRAAEHYFYIGRSVTVIL